MTKPRLSFTVDFHRNIEWKVRVVVWRTRKDLLKQADDKNSLAFCHRIDPVKAIKDPDSVAAEIHFSEGRNMKLAYIVHEAYHSLISVARLMNLRVVSANDDGEELAAESIERIVALTVAELKKHRIKIT